MLLVVLMQLASMNDCPSEPPRRLQLLKLKEPWRFALDHNLIRQQMNPASD